MKTKKMISQSMALLSALLFSATAVPNSYGQTIIEDTAIPLESGSSLDVGLSVFRNPTGVEDGDNTFAVFNIDFQPASITENASFIFQPGGLISLDSTQAEYYIAQPGQVFSVDSIAAGEFDLISSPVLPSAPVEISSRQFFQETDQAELVGSQIDDFREATQFYIAVATTSSFDFPDSVFPGDPDFPPRNIFGFALVELGSNSDSSEQTFEILDSAVAFGAGNIIIGQNAFAIPEPCSGIVFATLLGLGVARRRKR